MLALWLDLVSSSLVLVGVVWTAISLVRSHRRLTIERGTLRRISTTAAERRSAAPGTPDEADEWEQHELAASGIEYSTYPDLITLRQDLELAVINYLRPTLSVPFGIVVIGGVLGVIVSVLNVSAPPGG